MSEFLSRFLARGTGQAKALVTDDFGGSVPRTRAPYGTRRLWSVTKAGIFPGTRALLPALRDLALRSVEGRRPPLPLDTDAVDPAARFEFAREHFGRSEDGIALARDTSYEKFLLYFVLLTVLVSIDIASGRSMGRLIPLWLDLASRGALLALLSAVLLRSSFENWQLRTRSLGSLGHFLRRPAEWMAVPSPGWVSRSRGAITLFVVTASATVGGLIVSSASSAAAAMASTAPGSKSVVSNLFAAPTPSDFWYQLLGYVFPQVGPIAIGQALPIDAGIGAAFGAMSAALMAVAVSFFAYQTLVGVTETAHQGSVLGDRWHTIWGPLRVAYGFGMLAPVSGGYCLAQMLVLSVALMGGQIANSAWSAFVNNLGSTQIATPALAETLPLVRDVMLLEVCYAVEDHIVAKGKAYGGRPATVDNHPTKWPTTYAPGPQTKTLIKRGWSSFVYWWNSWMDSANNAGTQNPIVTRPAVWNYGNCGSISGDYSLDSSMADAAVLAMDSTRLVAFDALRSSLHGVATQLVESLSPDTGTDWSTLSGPLFTKVLTAKNTYDKAILAAAQTYADGASSQSLGSFQANATKHGWVVAGAYYMVLARIDSEVLSLTSVVPVATVGAGKGIPVDSDEAQLLFNKTTGAIPLLTGWWDQNVSGLPDPTATGSEGQKNNGLSQSAVNAGRFSNAGSLASATEEIGSVDSGVQAWLLKQAMVKSGTGNGLQQMADFGNLLLNVCLGILTVLGVGSLGATVAAANPEAALLKATLGKFVPGAESLKTALSFVVMWTAMIALALLIAGIVHAYILPLMPFILYTFAIMDMLVTVICGVIAAPVWAMMHINLEGEEMFKGKHGAGYMACFNILLGPVLTLFGLFFSVHLFEAMVWLLSMTLYPAMGAATAGHFFGVIGTLTYIIVITVLNYQMATRSFHLITQVPKRVSGWFGASPDGDNGEHHASGALGLVTSHTKQGLSTAQGASQGAAAAATSRRQAAAEALKAGGAGGAARAVAGGVAGQVASAGNAGGTQNRLPPA